MKNMTIIYFGGFDMPDKNAAAQRAGTFAKAMGRLGYKVILVGVNKTMRKQDEPKHYFAMAGYEVWEIAYPETTGQWISKAFSVSDEIGIIKQYPECSAVICYDYPAVSLLRISRLCNRLGILLIGEITEWYSPSKQGFIKSILKNADTYLRMQCVLPSLNHLICASRFLQSFYKKTVANTMILPTMVDMKDSKWLRLQAYRPNSIFTLGYAGDPGILGDKERLDLLVKAVCELNAQGASCRLKMAGFKRESLERDFPEILQYPYYEECVEYLGILPHKECLNLIRNVDFSVIIRENKRNTMAGFPTKLGESFACGTPVISTPAGDVASYICNGKNGYVTEGFSYHDILSAIKTAMTLQAAELMEMHCYTLQNNPLDYPNFLEQLDAFFAVTFKGLGAIS
jgi:glycosyltransferase involved in cell wall biosynthesis